MRVRLPSRSPISQPSQRTDGGIPARQSGCLLSVVEMTHQARSSPSGAGRGAISNELNMTHTNTTGLTHAEKIAWMHTYAAQLGCELSLEGECGFGRECVGISTDGKYPDYEWYNEDYERIDGNGDVWIPEHAYHKHPCVAVLGRGVPAESELYDWLRWFEANGFVLECGNQPVDPKLGIVAVLLGKDRYARMVRKS